MTDLEAVLGVGPSIAKKLRAVDITTAELLAVQHPDDLIARAGISVDTANKITKNARTLVSKFNFRSGIQLEEEQEAQSKLMTGIDGLDQRLMGGLTIGSLVEVYGKASAGKTQLCYHLAVRTQMPLEKGGLEGAVLWLDTEKSYKTEVIRANAVRWGLDSDSVLENIRSVDVVNTVHAWTLFERIPKMCAEENVRLVIIDSLTGQFRQEYKGDNRMVSRQQDINSMLNLMRRTALATDATFIYTNQIIASPGLGKFMRHDPVGGNIMSHGSDYRFMVSMAESGGRRLALKDHAGLPEFDVNLSLGWGGFYEDKYALKREEPSVIEYLVSRGYNTDFEDSS
jgi:DNA repair protein RadA